MFEEANPDSVCTPIGLGWKCTQSVTEHPTLDQGTSRCQAMKTDSLRLPKLNSGDDIGSQVFIVMPIMLLLSRGIAAPATVGLPMSLSLLQL